MNRELLELAAELSRRHRPFVTATVVWARGPSSCKRGSTAVIEPNGTVHGWIGGACAEPVVIREAPEAMSDGNRALPKEPWKCSWSRFSLSLTWSSSVGPRGDHVGHTGPHPRLEGRRRRREPGAPRGHWVLRHRDRHPGSLRRACRRVGLGHRGRLHRPGRFPQARRDHREIGVSIVADLVKRRAAGELRGWPVPSEKPHIAIDPVCGMEVEVATARWISDHDGETFYFCAPGCKATFEKAPAQYAGV